VCKPEQLTRTLTSNDAPFTQAEPRTARLSSACFSKQPPRSFRISPWTYSTPPLHRTSTLDRPRLVLQPPATTQLAHIRLRGSPALSYTIPDRSPGLPASSLLATAIQGHTPPSQGTLISCSTRHSACMAASMRAARNGPWGQAATCIQGCFSWTRTDAYISSTAANSSLYAIATPP
jgi:hypothetical protein